jgi:hypothetical protein
VAAATYMYALGCHVCQNGDVVGVCHHCGLPFCGEHLPVSRRAWYRIDPEYRGLELAELPAGEGAVHCSRHRHDRFNWHPFYRSAALFVFALLLPTLYLYQNGIRPEASLLALFLLAAGVFMLGFVADYLAERASEPPLPLFGRGPSLALREFVSGHVRLHPNGSYRAEVRRSTGRLDFRLAPDGSEQRRREMLQRRYHLRSLSRVGTNAGFLALQGKAHLQLQGAESAALERQPHILALAGPANGHPFFPLDGPPQPFTPSPQYHFAVNGGLPVRLLPALVSSEGEQDRQRELGLELTVQLMATPPQLLAGAEVVVKELVLCVPPQMGPVRSRRPAALAPGEEVRCSGTDYTAALSWQNVELLQDAEAPPVRANTPGYHRTFFVRFARSELLRHATVTGHLVLRVEQRLLSGLSGALFFSPLGRRRDDLTCDGHTEVRVNFELSMDSLVVHTPLARERKRQYAGPASYGKVVQLSRGLNRNGYYVKRLVEHTSGVVNRDDSRQVDRSWTIAGRTYRGVYPIDFEIMVSCPEVARESLDGEVTMVELRADALVNRRACIDALDTSVRHLLLICDGVFGEQRPAAEPGAGRATHTQRAGAQPDAGAGLPPGYDRQRQRDEQPPGV